MPVLKSDVQLANERFFDWLSDDSMKKQAGDSLTQFTRTRIREDGFMRKIMPPQTVTDDQLDRQYYTDKPVVIIDKENDLPPAISVPYGATPINYYIRGPRYQVTFQRILSPRITKDVSELATWNMDIRQVVSDNAIKDMLAEEDSKFIAAVNAAMIGQGSTNPVTGNVQWRQSLGGITRDTVNDALAVMPQSAFHLEAATMLLNNVTIYQLLKWRRDEVGGDLAEELLREGWNKKRLLNRDLLITIKRDLVPDSTMFFFADPRFIGKFLERQPVTMHVRREFWWLEFFMYSEIGASIGHVAGLSRVDFS